MQALATNEWQTAVARSAVYALLARGLAFPSPDHRSELRERVLPVVADLETGDPELDGALAEVRERLDQPLGALRDAHQSAFTHVDPEDHPPCESAYRTDDVFRQTQIMADVAGFYRAHGLAVGGTERERADHVVTQLEFMGFMAAKEAYALEHLGPDEVAECRRTQAAFLRDHLGCFGPALGRRLELAAPEPLVRALGRLLGRWLETDLDVLDVTPAERLDEPFGPTPPDDGSCGLECVLEPGGRLTP
ncbi:MAG: molecular chaperone TorD family protein [Acidimicrobiia bacterium]|nr:molecular chaperone TorD family protein [Acidimicrobiia bacterium]